LYRSRGKYRGENSRRDFKRKHGRRRERRGNSSRSVKTLSVNSLRQAIWVLENMEVGDGVYRVASSGGSGEVYEFTVERCSCEGFRRRGHGKQTTAALLFQAVKAVVSRLQEAGGGKGE